MIFGGLPNVAAFVIADGGGIDGMCVNPCCFMGSSNSGAGKIGLG